MRTVEAMCVLVLAGCAEETVAPASGCRNYDDSAHFVAAASFNADVLPIFQRSCNFNACHGSGTPRPQEGLWLGPFESVAASPEERTAIIAGLIGVRANLAEMDQVVPGDPAASFLLAKVEYADFLACETNRCVKLRCGGRMPRADPPLDEEELKRIRTWIRDGARDD